MKIYFAGSIRGGRHDVDLYLQLIEHLKKYGEVLTEHVGDKNVRIFHPVFDWWQKTNLFRMWKILSMLKNHLMRWNVATCRSSMVGGF